jgi:hypothetical protein
MSDFAMTSLETSSMKIVANKLSFLLVTHTTYFDIRFGRYEILKTCSSSSRFWTHWVYRHLIRLLGHNEGENCWGLNTSSEITNSAFLRLLKHMFLITTAMVMAI